MNGVLIREGKGRGPVKNIGDYVQSIAQRQFLQGKETCYVDIEQLSDFKSDEKVDVIMNGWFTWNCSKFLPPACINPLFVSFHLTPPKEKEFFTPEIIAYLKQYQPIGARDMLTMEMMKSHGIDSYFSGCLTMTLGKTYRQDNHDGGIYIIDPYVEFGGDKSLSPFKKLVRSILYLFKNYRKVRFLKDKFIDQYKTPISKLSRKMEHLIQTATFYELYSKRFSDDILLNAEYLTVLVDNTFSNEKKFQIADEMLKKYARAKCVITSRLHVSFPCLSMGTRNILVIPSIKTEEKEVKRYSGRLGGLDDTVTVLELENGRLIDTTDSLPLHITEGNFPANKMGYIKFKESLSEKVESFIRGLKN